MAVEPSGRGRDELRTKAGNLSLCLCAALSGCDLSGRGGGELRRWAQAETRNGPNSLWTHQADRQDPLPMLRCPGSPGFP